MLSGKRDSDPRPQPWQGCALPTELFPPFPSEKSGFPAAPRHKSKLFCTRLARKFRFLKRASLSIADAKVLHFSELPKLFCRFFLKKHHFLSIEQPQRRLHLIIYKLSERFFVVSGHNNMVVTDGFRQEIGGLLFVCQLDDLLCSAKVGIRFITHQRTFSNETA